MGDYSDRKKPNMRTIDSSPLVQSNCQAKSTLESTLERIEARLDRLENQAQYKQKYVPKQNNNPQRPAKGFVSHAPLRIIYLKTVLTITRAIITKQIMPHT